MKRPMLWALCFLIAGVLLRYGSNTALFLVLPVLCVCLFLHYKYWPVFLFLLFAAAGVGRTQHSLMVRIPEETEMLTLSGVVSDTGLTASGKLKMTALINWVDEQGERAARVMIYTRPGLYAEAEPGDKILMTGRINPLSKPLNPGDYNEFQYLRARKIDGTVFPESFAVTGNSFSITASLNRVKNKLSAVYDAALPRREALIIKSIVLGDKTELYEEIRNQYRYAGIYHLLCISGLHIAILMMAVNKALGLLINPRLAGIIALMIMIAYCLLTGASISSVRAVTMCGIAVFARVLFREYDLPSSAALACVALLIYEPLYLFDAGFQLSFGAVFGIALLTTPVEHALTLTHLPFPKSLKNALSANIAAVAATYPILSYHFYYLSTYSVLVNAIILPTATVLVVFGIIVGLAGLVWLPAGMFAAGVVYRLLKVYDFVCGFFNALPFSVLPTGCIGLAVCLAAAGVMAAFWFVFSGHGVVLKRRAAVFTASVLVLIVVAPLRAYPPGLTVTVPSAGSDNTVILQYRGRILIAGSGNPDVIAEYLDHMGVRKADGLFLCETNPVDWVYVQSLAERGYVDTVYLTDSLVFDEMIPVALKDVLLEFITVVPVEANGAVNYDHLSIYPQDSYIEVVYKDSALCFSNDTKLPPQAANSAMLVTPYVGSVITQDAQYTEPAAILGLQAVIINGDIKASDMEALHSGGTRVYSTANGVLTLRTNGNTIRITQRR